MQVEKLHPEMNLPGKIKPKKANGVSEDISTGLLKRKSVAPKEGIKVELPNIVWLCPCSSV